MAQTNESHLSGRPGKSGVGRPDKGDRHSFMTRVPRAAADAVMEAAVAAGLSYSEYISWVLCNAHGYETALPTGSASAPEQGRLPLASAS